MRIFKFCNLKKVNKIFSINFLSPIDLLRTLGFEKDQKRLEDMDDKFDHGLKKISF